MPLELLMVGNLVDIRKLIQQGFRTYEASLFSRDLELDHPTDQHSSSYILKALLEKLLEGA